MIKFIDYINVYSEIPELTKIYGRPTYDNLKVIKGELKTNSSTVSSSLGGGRYGDVGIVTTPQKFTIILVTPYVRPVTQEFLPYQQGSVLQTYIVK